MDTSRDNTSSFVNPRGLPDKDRHLPASLHRPHGTRWHTESIAAHADQLTTTDNLHSCTPGEARRNGPLPAVYPTSFNDSPSSDDDAIHSPRKLMPNWKDNDPLQPTSLGNFKHSIFNDTLPANQGNHSLWNGTNRGEPISLGNFGAAVPADSRIPAGRPRKPRRLDTSAQPASLPSLRFGNRSSSKMDAPVSLLRALGPNIGSPTTPNAASPVSKLSSRLAAMSLLRDQAPPASSPRAAQNTNVKLSARLSAVTQLRDRVPTTSSRTPYEHDSTVLPIAGDPTELSLPVYAVFEEADVDRTSMQEPSSFQKVLTKAHALDKTNRKSSSLKHGMAGVHGVDTERNTSTVKTKRTFRLKIERGVSGIREENTSLDYLPGAEVSSPVPSFPSLAAQETPAPSQTSKASHFHGAKKIADKIARKLGAGSGGPSKEKGSNNAASSGVSISSRTSSCNNVSSKLPESISRSLHRVSSTGVCVDHCLVPPEDDDDFQPKSYIFRRRTRAGLDDTINGGTVLSRSSITRVRQPFVLPVIDVPELMASPYGTRWALDLFSLPHNGLRHEMADLYRMLRTMWVPTPAVGKQSTGDVTISPKSWALFFGWWDVFREVVMEIFRSYQEIVFPWLEAAVSLEPPLDLDGRLSDIDLLRVLLQRVADIRSRVERPTAGDREALVDVVGLIQDAAGHLLLLMRNVEQVVPGQLEMFFNADQKEDVEEVVWASQLKGPCPQYLGPIVARAIADPVLRKRWLELRMKGGRRMLLPIWIRSCEGHHFKVTERVESQRMLPGSQEVAS